MQPHDLFGDFSRREALRKVLASASVSETKATRAMADLILRGEDVEAQRDQLAGLSRRRCELAAVLDRADRRA